MSDAGRRDAEALVAAAGDPLWVLTAARDASGRVVGVEVVAANAAARRAGRIAAGLADAAGAGRGDAARRTETALREREAEQAALRRVATAVAAAADPAAVFALVAEEVARLLGADGGLVSRFQDGRAQVMGVWSAPGAEHARVSVPSLSLDGETATAWVARTGRPARADAAAVSGPRLPSPPGKPLTGSVSAPVRVGAELWGAVSAVTARPGGPPPDAELRLGRFAELVSLAISNADARNRLAAQATTDPLTGLANHRVFHERLGDEVARAERYDRPLSLVLLDLDHFKQVNDRHGHRTGDAVLVEIAHRLAPLARLGEVMARVGGDEFGWLLPETDAYAAYGAAERARRAIGGVPFARIGRVTISAGVCDLTQARTAADLLDLADGALYWAKAQGRDGVYRYSPEVVDALSAQDRAERLARSHALTGLRALARAVDAKSGARTGHAERVAALCERLAQALGWPVERALLLREAALLHDVGKIGLPERALRRPDLLSAEERALAHTHPALGAQISGEVLAPEQTAWIRGHHERWDGRGYPDGLAREAIPDGAQVLALVEACESSGAPDDLLGWCRAGRGGRFAPDVVAALEELARRGELAPAG